VHPCTFRGHLGAIVPFQRRFDLLSEQEYLLGILFSCFLIIENVCSGIYLKIDVVNFRKIFIA